MHLSARESVEHLRRAQAVGTRASAEATPHHLCLTDEAVRTLDPNLKMNPPLRSEDDRTALLDALRDGTIAAIATDHAPHSPEEKDVPFEAAPFGVTGLETAFAALYTELVEPGLLSLETLLERMSAGPGGDLRPRPAAHRGRRAGEPDAARPREHLARQGRRLPLALVELVAARPAADRPGAADDRRRPGGARMTTRGMLVLEDGEVFAGESVGARGLRVRRGGVHDVDERLPGGGDRSRASRARSSASRRRWSATTASTARAASRTRAHAKGGRDARGARPAVDGLAARARSRCAHRRRHALARPASARARRDARRGRQRGARHGRGVDGRPGTTRDGRLGTRRGRLDEGAVHLRRRRRRARRGRRLRLQALDPAPARGERRRRRRLPARRRRRHDRRVRRRAPLTGAWRPRAARRRDERGARAARPDAGARRLPRPPAARARDRHGDVQAAVRPPRREPSGARPPHEPRARDRPEPRLRGRHGRRRERHAHVALRRHRRRASTIPSCARGRRSSTPRRRPARTMRRRSSPAGSTI